MVKLPTYLSTKETNEDINSEFKGLISKIKECGLETAPRGQSVKEIYLHTMALDPTKVLLNFKERPRY